MEQNYSVMDFGTFGQDLAAKGRVMAGQELSLTGCEVSFNYLAPNKFPPFVHTHKLNEEVYIVVSGEGQFKIDDKEFPIREGNVIRVAPAGERAIKAGDGGMSYICIQAQKGSLTSDDGVVVESKASWM